MSSPEHLIGRQIGRYTITSHLASGGMAELFIARQEAVGGFEKDLVLKMLQAHYAENPRVVRMFLDEARLAAKLNHQNIVHVYDVSEADGIRYIAMEYIHGETVTDIVRRSIARGGFLPIEHAVQIVADTAAGLAYAHDRRDAEGRTVRIIHRDVSPSNILVTYEGQTKIVDFGIARIQDQIREESGMRPGKVSYMSPEQVRGEAVDHRSDVFSLGIILYEITVGRRLWRGPPEAVMRRIVEEQIPPPTYVRREYPPAPIAPPWWSGRTATRPSSWSTVPRAADDRPWSGRLRGAGLRSARAPGYAGRGAARGVAGTRLGTGGERARARAPDAGRRRRAGALVARSRGPDRCASRRRRRRDDGAGAGGGRGVGADRRRGAAAPPFPSARAAPRAPFRVHDLAPATGAAGSGGRRRGAGRHGRIQASKRACPSSVHAGRRLVVGGAGRGSSGSRVRSARAHGEVRRRVRARAGHASRRCAHRGELGAEAGTVFAGAGHRVVPSRTCFGRQNSGPGGEPDPDRGGRGGAPGAGTRIGGGQYRPQGGDRGHRGGRPRHGIPRRQVIGFSAAESPALRKLRKPPKFFEITKLCPELSPGISFGKDQGRANE
jgi:hypothetical protein